MKKTNHFGNWIWPALLCAMGTGFSGCVPRSESEVVIYASVDREYADPILNAFQRVEKGPQVARQYDVESSKTVGLATRIFQESNRPRCDVFWNGEIVHTIRMQRAGLLETRNWHLPADWPKNDYAASDGTWVGVGARARVLVVNRGLLIKEQDWPQSVEELADPKWKKKCGVAKPLFGTTATHFLVLATSHHDTPESLKEHHRWLEEVAQNAVVLGGNKQVAQAVSSGQLVWGLTDTDDAQIEIDNGANLSIVFPDQDVNKVGCLLIPTTVSVMKRSPNPIAADALASYLASAKVESRLTLGNVAAFALWPANEKSISSPQTKIRFMDVDFEASVEHWESNYEKLQQVFR